MRRLVNIHMSEKKWFVFSKDRLNMKLKANPVIHKAGDVMFIPAWKIHAANNVSTTNAPGPAIYIVEKGKELVVLVK